MASNPMTDAAGKHTEPTNYCARCGLPLNQGLPHSHPDSGEPKLVDGHAGQMHPSEAPFTVKK